jgi:hypothetical protein
MKAYPQDSDGRFMDLRDYFAIRFAQSQIELIKDEQFDALETFKTSYKLADIMMKAREK